MCIHEKSSPSPSVKAIRRAALPSLLLFTLMLGSPSAYAMGEAERAFLASQEQMQRDLMNLQMQARVLEQRVKVGELERDLRKAQEPVTPAPPVIPPGFPMMIPGGGPPIDLRGLPPGIGPGGQVARAEPELKLLSVHGFQGRFTADLQRGTARMRVSVGDTVEDGWRVSAIEAARITMTKGRQTRTVGFQ